MHKAPSEDASGLWVGRVGREEAAAENSAERARLRRRSFGLRAMGSDRCR